MFAVRPMFSAGGIVNPLPGGTFEDVAVFPNSAAITLIFASNGQINSGDHLWFDPVTSNIGSSYWIRATLTAGTTPTTGTLNTWMQLSVNRSWSNLQSGAGTKSSTLLIEIATDPSGSNIVTSGTYTIIATVESAS